MKLRFAATSPFARKARVCILELGLADRVEQIPTDPWTDPALRIANPLGKVPALELPDGVTLYDSPVVCEFLDAEAGGSLFPPRGPKRWRSLRRQALGDGLAEAVVRRFVELRRPPEQRGAAVIARQTEAIAYTLAALEAEAQSLSEPPTIGEISIGCALGYLDFRNPDEGWRAGHPDLARWFAVFDARPAMQATRPPAV
ncbi:glutathione S-transferase family protein [Ferrovibrio xuzhouensis]|uniref:Glutathione S-transferase family protein n=1 Tax=Ferrovibrio xuzhouensis TaxID=1576914 RepID=A0ABV7VA11_9PROT